MEKKKLSTRELLKNLGYSTKLIVTVYPEFFACRLFWMLTSRLLNFFSGTYMLRYVVNGVQEGKSLQDILQYMLIVFALNIVYCIFEQLTASFAYPIFQTRGEARINKRIYRKAAESDISNYDDPEAYELYNKAISSGKDSVLWYGYKIIHITFMFFGISLESALILSIDPVLLIFAFFPVLFNGYHMKLSEKQHDYMIHEKEIARKKAYTVRSFYLAEYAKEMRLTNIGRVMLRRFSDSCNEYINLIKTEGVPIALGYWVVRFLVPAFVKYGAMIYASYHALVSGRILMGDCLVILNSINTIALPIQSFSSVFGKMYENMLDIKDLRDFLQREPAVSNPSDGLIAKFGNIELRNVYFRYNGTENDILKNINMNIRRGEKIAIVGHNGAGKTTLVKLLMRLYDTTGGAIYLDGNNIKRYDLESYRGSFGTVFQDYRNFSLSVAENVLGRPYREDDEETVCDALKKAGLWEKVSKTEKGIHTVMTREFEKDGLILSGGEAQKLSIAAVYASGCNVVILDEPSSALDPIAEHEMYENMKRACEGKTMIFISHRLSSAVSADRIYLMDGGTVKESGNHAELMAKNGMYAEMFTLQAKNYLGEKTEVI